MRARAIISAGMLLWCCPQLVAGVYGTMPAVVTRVENAAFEADQSQPEFNLVSSCMHPSWTLFESAHGDECRCYDDRFIVTSKTCMACLQDVPGICSDTTAVTSGDCSPLPVELDFVAEVDINVEEFNEGKQEAYKSAVAKSLQVEPAAVMITQYYSAGSRRRLLEATKGVIVKTKVVVPPGKMPDVSETALAATLQREMEKVEIKISGIKDVGVATTEPVADTPAPVLSTPVKLEFQASVVGNALEFLGKQSAWESAVANSFQVELAAVTVTNIDGSGFSRRRLLATTDTVIVHNKVLVAPERVPDVSETALAATLQSEMQDAGIEIRAISNARVTTIEVVAPTTNTTTTPVASGELPTSTIFVVAGVAGGLVLLCLLCGCYVCMTRGDDQTTIVGKAGLGEAKSNITFNDGRGMRTIVRQISVSDICV